jgi:hypothetical protein
MPVTTVKLSRQETWKGRNDAVEIRMIGGNLPDGTSLSTDGEFTQGASVIIFPEYQFGDGAYAIRPDLLFNETDGGFTNGTVWSEGMAHPPVGVLSIGAWPVFEREAEVWLRVYSGYNIAVFTDSVDKMTPKIGYMPGSYAMATGREVDGIGRQHREQQGRQDMFC